MVQLGWEGRQEHASCSVNSVTPLGAAGGVQGGGAEGLGQCCTNSGHAQHAQQPQQAQATSSYAEAAADCSQGAAADAIQLLTPPPTFTPVATLSKSEMQPHSSCQSASTAASGGGAGQESPGCGQLAPGGRKAAGVIQGQGLNAMDACYAASHLMMKLAGVELRQHKLSVPYISLQT